MEEYSLPCQLEYPGQLEDPEDLKDPLEPGFCLLLVLLTQISNRFW